MVDTESRPSISPYECTHQLIDDIETANGEMITSLAHVTYIRLALLLCPGVKTIIPAENMIHYTVEPFAAFQINVAATGNRDAYEMLTEICRANTFSGVPIPKEMRAACSLIISGQYRKPSGRGPKPRSDFGLFFISYLLGRYISDAYGLPKTRGDGMEEISSADIVSRVLTERGLDASSTKIRDYLTHGKHKFSREKSDWIREMMYEPYLEDFGLISRKRIFGISPFGTFMPMFGHSDYSHQ